MINVLIVDDSAVVRQYLEHLLGGDKDIRIAGAVKSGEEALRAIKDKKPDVVTMDIVMPGIDGFETTRRIMEECPVPVVMVSAHWSSKDAEKTSHAMEAGALAIMQTPRALAGHGSDKSVQDLIRTVKAMAGVPLVRRRWRRDDQKVIQRLPASDAVHVETQANTQLVAVGASTGGPPVIQKIIQMLPKPFGAPVLIVQHMAPGFLTGMVDWLNETTGVPIHIAAHGGKPLPGHVYLAPDSHDMGIGTDGTIRLSKCQSQHCLCPSVAHLFQSVAKYGGPKSVGILLTGMGSDGAKELKLMRDAGAVTVAQDKDSSAVHGMPGEAIKFGGAEYILSPEHIAALLGKLIS